MNDDIVAKQLRPVLHEIQQTVGQMRAIMAGAQAQAEAADDPESKEVWSRVVAAFCRTVDAHDLWVTAIQERVEGGPPIGKEANLLRGIAKLMITLAELENKI